MSKELAKLMTRKALKNAFTKNGWTTDTFMQK